MTPELYALFFGLTALLGLTQTFFFFILRGFRADVEGLKKADQKMGDELKNCIQKEDFREFRNEQREMFDKLFLKIDSFSEKLAGKADRQ